MNPINYGNLQNYLDKVEEQTFLFDTPIIILRFNGFTGGNDPAGVAPVRNTNSIFTMARVVLLTGQDILFSGGTYQLGDLKVTTRFPIQEANSQANPVVQADMMQLQDGLGNFRQYELQGRVYKVPLFSGGAYYGSYWRRVT